jgi:hypothetical protein
MTIPGAQKKGLVALEAAKPYKWAAQELNL